MTDIKTPVIPSVLWAQRSSATNKQRNFIYLTVSLLGIIHSTLKYSVTDISLSLNVNAKEEDKERKYAFALDFHARVIPKALKKCATSQSVTLVIFKRDFAARHWPDLSKNALPYVKTDFSRWTWEGDKSDDVEEDCSTYITTMDMDNSSAGTKSGKLPNECLTPSSVTTSAAPRVLWAQRSSPTERMKNVISLYVNVQDIAESILKCTVTDTSISFRAYARGDREEREYAFDLDFYAEVISEAVENHLTEECLTIILLKKQMNARYWSHLYKTRGLLSYVRTDFKRWTWEGDQSDDIINECTDSGTPEEIGGQCFRQMGELDNRGLLFSSRFERPRETGDIKKAISFFGDAVQLTLDGHANKPGRLNNLGISLSRRLERLGEMGDIEKAISSLEDAVQLIPDGPADKPSRLSNLGISLLRCFRRLGEMGDIEKTISSLEDAVRLTPDGHTDKPGQLSNLGYSLLRHFERLGEMGDIEKAISGLEDEVQLTPDGHADKPSLLNNIGSSLFSHFEFCQDTKDLKRSIFAAYQSATQSTGPPSHRFHAAISWSHRAHLCRDDSVPSALDAYATAFELLPRMSWVGLSIRSRHRELVSARTLGCDAAATAISEKHLHKALEWLEQGRSVLWGQILHLRTPLDGLHAADPKLAAKLTSIATDLERGSSQAFLAGDDNQVAPEDAIQKHRQLVDEWETVVEQVRKLPDFERFLLPKEYSELRDAARSGPVIVLNASRYGCDALIIASPLELRHVRLDKLTYEHADFLLKLLYAALDSQQLRDERHLARLSENQLDKDATFRDVLGQLWEMVVKPVLGCIESLQLQGDLHIRWCPTGPLAFLPIHAAGIYNADGTVSHSLADVAVSSYTPSLTALLNSSGRQVSEQSSGELLVVSQVNSPGVKPLPGAAKELQYIHDRASDLRLSYHSMQGQEATVTRVLSAMKKYPWVHFACHGIQDTADPMNSGLRLSDGLLQLSDIIKEPLPNAEFAFLSACQTATGDESCPEEAIHLAAGMLLAGYRSVVGTMWSIGDNVAPLVADEVYGQILGDGKLNSAKAAQALQTAVRDLRERGHSFALWVPFIHMGV